VKGKQLRLRRFFSRGKAVIVPMDHPVYFGAIPGLIRPEELVRDAAQTPADGLLLTLATLNRTAEYTGQLATIARLDGTHTRFGRRLVETDRFSSVEHAVAAGADACVLNIYTGAENERSLLGKLGKTAEECERWGLPLVGEMIPILGLAGHYGPAEKPDEGLLAEQTAVAARVGAEMGADLIKTNWTGSKESFRRVVEEASVPVLVAGGPSGKSVEALLQMVEDCLAAGAAGICMGRNVWQHTNRIALLRALCRMVHEGASAAQAAEELDRG
jgi:DhnA family fructose-bisphosphate aldolase class Ia